MRKNLYDKIYSVYLQYFKKDWNVLCTTIDILLQMILTWYWLEYL